MFFPKKNTETTFCVANLNKKIEMHKNKMQKDIKMLLKGI